MSTKVLVRPGPETFRAIASPWHTSLLLVVQGLLAYWGKVRTDHVRTLLDPDRVSIYGRTIFFEWLVLALVIAGVWLHGSSVLTVLGERWRSARQVLVDIGIAVLFLIGSSIVISMISSHGGGDDSATQFILPHGNVEMALWVVLSITAGFCEEAVYRGYLQRQFMAWTRNVPAGILLSAAAFGVSHSYQGFRHAFNIGLLGVMGGMLAYWRKSVRPGMISHALQDVLGGLIRH